MKNERIKFKIIYALTKIMRNDNSMIELTIIYYSQYVYLDIVYLIADPLSLIRLVITCMFVGCSIYNI